MEILGLYLFIFIGQIDEVKLSSSRSKVKIFHIKFDAVSRIKWPSLPCFFLTRHFGVKQIFEIFLPRKTAGVR